MTHTITSAEIDIELDPAEFASNSDSDLIEQATTHLYDFAAGIGAEVQVEVTQVAHRHSLIRLEVSGHYLEVSAFNRSWNQE